MATKLVVEPIFEADFLPVSYGFRPKRSATEALEAIRVAANGGYNHVADVDIKDYFGSIDHHRLMAEVSRDRKSTRLNSSHSQISYAVFCLKKKKTTTSSSISHITNDISSQLPSILS